MLVEGENYSEKNKKADVKRGCFFRMLAELGPRRVLGVCTEIQLFCVIGVNPGRDVGGGGMTGECRVL